LQDSLARHSVWQEKDKDLMMTIRDYAEERCSWM